MLCNLFLLVRRPPSFLSWATAERGAAAASFRFLSLFRKDRGQFGHQIQSISRSSLAVMLSSRHFVTGTGEHRQMAAFWSHWTAYPLYSAMAVRLAEVPSKWCLSFQLTMHYVSHLHMGIKYFGPMLPSINVVTLPRGPTHSSLFLYTGWME